MIVIHILNTWAFFKQLAMQKAFTSIIAISIFSILFSDFLVINMGTSNCFVLKPFKLLIVATFELVSSILVFCLLLFIYLFFLLDNLFGVCINSVIFTIEPVFIIFVGIISFIILTAAIFIYDLGWLNIVAEVQICV